MLLSNTNPPSQQAASISRNAYPNALWFKNCPLQLIIRKGAGQGIQGRLSGASQVLKTRKVPQCIECSPTGTCMQSQRRHNSARVRTAHENTAACLVICSGVNCLFRPRAQSSKHFGARTFVQTGRARARTPSLLLHGLFRGLQKQRGHSSALCHVCMMQEHLMVSAGSHDIPCEAARMRGVTSEVPCSARFHFHALLAACIMPQKKAPIC